MAETASIIISREDRARYRRTAVVDTLLTHTRIESLPWEEDLSFLGVVGQVLDRVPAP